MAILCWCNSIMKPKLPFQDFLSSCKETKETECPIRSIPCRHCQTTVATGIGLLQPQAAVVVLRPTGQFQQDSNQRMKTITMTMALLLPCPVRPQYLQEVIPMRKTVLLLLLRSFRLLLVLHHHPHHRRNYWDDWQFRRLIIRTRDDVVWWELS